MNMHSKIELTNIVANRYFNASKLDKGVILTEFCLNTGYERKYAIKKIRKAFLYPKRVTDKNIRKKRVSKYMIIKSILKKLWVTQDCPSGTRLHPMIPHLVALGIKYNELDPTQEQLIKLSQISSASIDRLLKSELRLNLRRINGQTKQGKLKYDIPFAIDSGTISTPGTLEIDLVCHCGSSAMGEFIYTLNTTDIITGWYEAEAILGKSQKTVDEAMHEIAKRLPFKLNGIDSDNGAEFINSNLKRFAHQLNITFTRSRPYKKNDNAHIEQKNFTHVRKIIGYVRLDTRDQQNLLNDLYRNELRLYINFFQTSQKLIQKQRIGSNIRRTYDIAKTPYQRVMLNDNIPDDIKHNLTSLYETLNPFDLKRRIDKKLNKIMSSA